MMIEEQGFTKKEDGKMYYCRFAFTLPLPYTHARERNVEIQ